MLRARVMKRLLPHLVSAACMSLAASVPAQAQFFHSNTPASGAYADPRGSYLDRPMYDPAPRGGYDYAPRGGEAYAPPPEMLRRRPDLPRHMEGGIDNPLGARALYLYRGGKDTLFRIHGTNEPWTIGQAVSSGCIRMRNEDVIDLYERVQVDTKVVVI